jgi:predicted transcriptional regulator
MQTEPRQTPAARHDAWYDEQVKSGLEDIEAGRTISHEDVVKKSAELLKQLEQEHGQKAA